MAHVLGATMYKRSERPMTEGEPEPLDARLRQVKDTVGELGLLVPFLSILDAFFHFALILFLRGEDRSGPGGVVAGGVAALLFNAWLLAASTSLTNALRERRRLREALADGVAVVE